MSESPPSTDPRADLAALVADLDGWLSYQRGLHARQPTAPLPSVAPATDPPPPPPRPPRPAGFAAIQAEMGDCRRCALHRGRKQIVFGVGDPDADIVFVGEGPGYHEDREGVPFVGDAGQLLTRMIGGVLGLGREAVYICNVVKCRPPGNRDPEPAEVDACAPFLHAQIDAIKPVVVVPLGRFAVQTLLGSGTSIGRLRGRVHSYRGAALIPTYHPAYLLRYPADKRKVFDDLKLVRQEYERRAGRSLPPMASRREPRGE